LYIILGLIAIIVIASLIWRRDTLPCPSWLAWMVEMDNPFTEVNRARVITGLLGLVPGMRVLDAGCGPGRLTLSQRPSVRKAK
jgi:2-polyprenyl-3-methyl-5-hydroxy-6-metoxy-1,4-benzoquinol methylase